MTRIVFATLGVALTLSGCSAEDGLFRRLGDPQPLHDEQKLPLAKATDPATQQPVINAIPVEAYLNAMRAAYNAPENPGMVARYVDTGIAVSDAYCTRWFQRLDESQRRITFAQNNFNVVRQLGTALIGVASLHSDVTTVYGAVNTAIEGVNANVNEALFLAPDTAVIKRRVMQAMADRAGQLRGAQAPQRFVEAYVQLERYADMCSFVSARQYVNQAISAPAARATADPETGAITLQGAATRFQAEQFDNVRQMIVAVDRLDGVRAVQLASNPPVAPEPGFRDDLDISTEAGAKAYLKNLLVETTGDRVGFDKWAAALSR